MVVGGPASLGGINRLFGRGVANPSGPQNWLNPGSRRLGSRKLCANIDCAK